MLLRLCAIPQWFFFKEDIGKEEKEIKLSFFFSFWGLCISFGTEMRNTLIKYNSELNLTYQKDGFLPKFIEM